jgi:uncharacterized oxidoreductase
VPVLRPDALTHELTRILIAVGTPAAEAALVAEHLVEAEAAGVDSHGVIRVPQYVRAIEEGRIVPNARLAVVKETAATAVLDGGHGFGQVMARRAMDKAIELAQRAGVGVVTLVNCSHTGRLGSYTEHAAGHGKIGIVMVNAGGHGQRVAPFGGTAGRLATNPISIGLPAGAEFPLVLDMATSAAPEGKIRAMLAAGKPIPDGWVITHEGRSTTNPADLYGPPRGGLLPFGGHKGFGLAVMIDALAGILSGAGCCHEVDAPMDGKTDGVFLMALSVDAFLPVSHFAEQVSALIRHVKSSPLASGVEEVLVPGEIEARRRARARQDGIEVADAVWHDLAAMLDRLGGNAAT